MRKAILAVSMPWLIVLNMPVQADSAAQMDPKAVARLQFMVRQLSSEKEALTAENTKLNAEVEDVRRKFGDLRSKAQSALTQFKEQSNNLSEKLRELDAAYARQTGELKMCMQSNVKLYDSHRDLLRDYDRKGVFSSLLQLEPVTGLKQVAIENLIEEYRERIDQLQIKSAAAATTGTDASAPAPRQVVDLVTPGEQKDNPGFKAGKGSIGRIRKENALPDSGEK